MQTKTSWFPLIARKVSYFAGTPMAFTIAIGFILRWLVCGPIFHYSDTWQLVINTGITTITFLMATASAAAMVYPQRWPT